MNIFQIFSPSVAAEVVVAVEDMVSYMYNVWNLNPRTVVNNATAMRVHPMAFDHAMDMVIELLDAADNLAQQMIDPYTMGQSAKQLLSNYNAAACPLTCGEVSRIVGQQIKPAQYTNTSSNFAVFFVQSYMALVNKLEVMGASDDELEYIFDYFIDLTISRANQPH